jgi:hypothetical protein
MLSAGLITIRGAAAEIFPIDALQTAVKATFLAMLADKNVVGIETLVILTPDGASPQQESGEVQVKVYIESSYYSLVFMVGELWCELAENFDALQKELLSAVRDQQVAALAMLTNTSESTNVSRSVLFQQQMQDPILMINDTAISVTDVDCSGSAVKVDLEEELRNKEVIWWMKFGGPLATLDILGEDHVTAMLYALEDSLDWVPIEQLSIEKYTLIDERTPYVAPVDEPDDDTPEAQEPVVASEATAANEVGDGGGIGDGAAYYSEKDAGIVDDIEGIEAEGSYTESSYEAGTVGATDTASSSEVPATVTADPVVATADPVVATAVHEAGTRRLRTVGASGVYVRKSTRKLFRWPWQKEPKPLVAQDLIVDFKVTNLTVGAADAVIAAVKRISKPAYSTNLAISLQRGGVKGVMLGDEFLRLIYISEPLIITNTGIVDEVDEEGLTLVLIGAIGASALLFIVILSVLIGCCVVRARRKNAAPHTKFSPHPHTISHMLNGYQNTKKKLMTPRAGGVDFDDEEDSLFCGVDKTCTSKRHDGGRNNLALMAESESDEEESKGLAEEEANEGAKEGETAKEEPAKEEPKESKEDEEPSDGQEHAAAEEGATEAEAEASAADEKPVGGTD